MQTFAKRLFGIAEQNRGRELEIFLMDRMAEMAVFVQVVETASFSEAARRVGLSKSSVSTHVAQLEERLGAQLLHRTTRRLALTEVGRVFYERSAKIVHEVEEAELEARRSHAAPQGLLKVNAPLTFGQLQLAPAIAEFLGNYREVRIDVTLNDRVMNPFEGGFDVTVRVTPPLADSSLIARRLAPNRLVVCGAPEYLARRGVPQRPADLVQHECLVYTHFDAWRFAHADGPKSVRVAGRLRCNNGDLLRSAALRGLGLAQLPTFIVGPDIARGALQTVLVSYEDRSTGIWALYSPTRHLSAKVRAFVDFLAAHFGPRPDWDVPANARTRVRRSRRSAAV
jgi:DNA-binding transcriptional LysR family regulator